MSAELGEAQADKADALRDVWNPGEKLVLFRPRAFGENVPEDFVPIDFTSPDGRSPSTSPDEPPPIVIFPPGGGASGGEVPPTGPETFSSGPETFSFAPLTGPAEVSALTPAAEAMGPRTFLDFPYVAPTGATINVGAGGNLQTAFNNAQPGDTIVLAAGASFVGNFHLPLKPDSTKWIYVRTSNLAGLPPAGTRVTPADASAMARISSATAGPALKFSPATKNWRFVGIEVSATGTLNYNLIYIGGTRSEITTVQQCPQNIVFDRCYLHAHDGCNCNRAILACCGALQVSECWIDECHVVGQDAQTICGWNGPGPFRITNNHLEASTEGVMFGGGDSASDAMHPRDIEIRYNYFLKPLRWKPGDPSFTGAMGSLSKHWTVKEGLELKAAQFVLVEHNVIENCWVDGQTGTSMAVKTSNAGRSAPWTQTQDVIVRRNYWKGCDDGFVIVTRANDATAGWTRRVRFEDNVVARHTPIVRQVALTIVSGYLRPDGTTEYRAAEDIVFNHNTFVNAGNGGNTDAVIFSTTSAKYPRFTYTNNITGFGKYGFASGNNQGFGMTAVNACTVDSDMSRNAMANKPSTSSPANYPSDYFFDNDFGDCHFLDETTRDYRLGSASPYKNAAVGPDGLADGSDLGSRTIAADLAFWERAITGGASTPEPVGPAVGRAIETDLALPRVFAGTWHVTTGRANEHDTAAALKRATFPGRANETDAAFGLSFTGRRAIALGRADETDAAFRRSFALFVARADEADLALATSFSGGRTFAPGRADELDEALLLYFAGMLAQVDTGLAVETDTAFARKPVIDVPPIIIPPAVTTPAIVGEVKTAWRKERRYYDRGTVARMAVKVFITRRNPANLLSMVSHFAILRRISPGVYAGNVQQAEPDGGIPTTADEAAYRWLGGKIVQEGWSPTPPTPPEE